MRKLLLTIVVAAGVCGHALAQDNMDFSAMFKVPAEMKQLDYLIGSWEGEEKLIFGPSPTIAKVQLKFSKVLNNRWIEQLHTYTGPEMMKPMVGKMITSYDADKKVWRAYWFDSGAGFGASMQGTLTGNTMIFTSEPFEMPGFAGKVVAKSTFVKKSDTEFTFKYEQAGADEASKKQAAAMGAKSEWTTFIEGTYKKKSKS